LAQQKIFLHNSKINVMNINKLFQMYYIVKIHTCISGLELVDKVNGTVGLATPSRTGAIKLSAVSHNSSIEIFIND